MARVFCLVLNMRVLDSFEARLLEHMAQMSALGFDGFDGFDLGTDKINKHAAVQQSISLLMLPAPLSRLEPLAFRRLSFLSE